MRLSWLVLLCAATAAFCQSPTAPKMDPDKLFQLPDHFTGQAPDFVKFIPRPIKWNNLVMPPLGTVVPGLKLNHEIDPKIIVRPPWENRSKEQDFECEVDHNRF